jgi:hypothetical protein
MHGRLAAWSLAFSLCRPEAASRALVDTHLERMSAFKIYW